MTTVRQLLDGKSPEVHAVAPDAAVIDAIRLMAEKGIGAVLVTVSPGEQVEHCLQLVTDYRIRHLPVVEGAQVLGVISIGDLVKSVIDAQRRELDHLQQYIVAG
jgi:CBS domain-containing protein